jgi:hypothetical protein
MLFPDPRVATSLALKAILEENIGKSLLVIGEMEIPEACSEKWILAMDPFDIRVPRTKDASSLRKQRYFER